MIEFNKNQLACLEKLRLWNKETNCPFFILSGISGSGKSSVLREFIKEIPPGKLVITAPTSEALENLAEDLPQYSAMTCHKLLGYRPTETCDEKQILVRAGSRKNAAGVWVDPPPRVVNYEYVILEEAYYSPGIIIDSIFDKYRHIKWIFLGDYKQLPPVDEFESRLLSYEDRVDYRHDLSEDMRSTCPIQKELVAQARLKGLKTNFNPYIISKPTALRNIMNAYDGDPNSFSFLALAYEHKVVDKVAAAVRDIVYNYSPEMPPQPGEIIRLSGVVDLEGHELVRNNERVEVLHFAGDMILVKRKNGEEVALDLDSGGELKTLYDAAKASRKPIDWRAYHNRARQYAQIRSAFATTIHSSQGRTEENTLIVLDNMLKCRSDNLAYVSVGRSRNVPWFVQSW